jgi:CRP-like cAMP-binding protein
MTQTDMLAVLRSHPFTQGLGESQLEGLAEMAEVVDIEPELPLFGSGERSQYFYLLLSGTVFLELQTAGYTVRIQQLGSGEAFGWSALVDEPYRTFQVRALQAGRAVRLPGDRLVRACEADDRLGSLLFRRLAEMVAQRLRATEVRFAEFCRN